ncbi:MAG TPA: MBL fold metallo-hydrolase, partial [Thermoanaerobaculia bacterium]
MQQNFKFWIAFLLLVAVVRLPAHAQADPTSRSLNQPVEPYRIVGNIYYVGASDVTSYLITTPEGHILLDGGYVETAPMIEANLKKLGFKLADVKILLSSHAHFDHVGGLAELKRRTGAKFAASERDAPLLARGGKGDFLFETLMPQAAPEKGENSVGAALCGRPGRGA